ncbi:MAG: cyclase family protein [Clostridia bacterium]
MIDLTRTLYDQIQVYPGDTQFKLSQTAHVNDDKYNAFTASTGMHVGTHIDMPLHFINNGAMACDIELSRFIGRAVIIDARGENIIYPREEYKILQDSIVLICTGHAELFGTSAYYQNYPVIDRDFADMLVEKGVKMLGVDTPGPDMEPYTLHNILLQNNVLILENLVNLEQLIGISDVKLIALPLKIEAEASPVRAIAFTENISDLL